VTSQCGHWRDYHHPSSSQNAERGQTGPRQVITPSGIGSDGPRSTRATGVGPQANDAGRVTELERERTELRRAKGALFADARSEPDGSGEVAISRSQ
jgi:hypothetical protein